MHSENCNIVTSNGNFFDITHSFKVGSATYHVLGARKDRPTYKNTYYIFNCSGNDHESSARSKHLTRSSEFVSVPIQQRPRTAHHTTRTSIEDLPIKSTTSRHRTQTEPPKKAEFNATAIQENLTETIKNNRLLLISSLRRELNMKKKSIIRSMKKEKQALLQATIEANKKDEIIRLLDEQKVSFTNIYERFMETIQSSIESLKQTLIETLEIQLNSARSAEHIRDTLIQTIEQEVRRITLQNDEILRTTSAETNVLNQLQTTICNKIDDDSRTIINNQNETVSRLFDEQNQVLTNVLVEQQQQQQILSQDLVKQTVIDTLNEQKSMSANVVNNTRQPQELISVDVVNTSPQEQNSLDNNNVNVNKQTNQSLSRTKPIRSTAKLDVKKPVDQHLFRISVRSPESAHIYAKLFIDGMECSRRLHTLCQRDVIQENVYNCYFTPPPTDGPYEPIIYSKTKNEVEYQISFNIRLPGAHHSQPVIFPMRYQAFEQHQCILIEPLQGSVQHNARITINMVVPGAKLVKIRNGDETLELDGNEYKNDIVKKKVRVRGDIYVIGCWDEKTDSVICVFKMN